MLIVWVSGGFVVGCYGCLCLFVDYVGFLLGFTFVVGLVVVCGL